MFGGHASPEANSILRYGRVIHRRDPETASPQFMTNPIHPLPIADNNRHYVSCRCPGVDPEIAKLRVEVVSVFPKLHTQFWLARAELERFENCRDHNGRQRARVNVRMCVKTQILQRFFRTGDESSQGTKRLGE